MIFAHVVNQKLLFVEHVATEAEPILSHLFGAEFGSELPQIIRLFDYSNSWDRIVLFGIRYSLILR